MKIGLASYKFINNNISFNIKQVEKAIIKTPSIDMLCFGEAFIQGFDSLSWNYEIDKNIAIEQNSEEINKLVELSKQYNIDLAFGYIEKDQENIYSSYMIIINGKMVYNYRRISKGWKDTSKADYHYKEGNEILSFDYMNHHITIALCGDIWEYPKKFKCDGLLLWPVYVDYTLEKWESSEKEYEEQANLVCKETLMINSLCKNPISHGNAFYFSNGKTVKSLSYDNEGVLIIDINN